MAHLVREPRTALEHQRGERSRQEPDPDAVQQAKPDQAPAQSVERFVRDRLQSGPPSCAPAARRLWYPSRSERI